MSQKEHNISPLESRWFETPLGPMIAIANQDALYLLEFKERRGLTQELKKLEAITKSKIISESSLASSIILNQIQKEIEEYFEGALNEFKTPIHLLGTPFQNCVWEELRRIPYGQTRSYQEQSRSIGREKAYRAVANANGTNQLAIIVPCHRVVRHNGDLGGYGGGISRKKWLLEHEKNIQNKFK